MSFLNKVVLITGAASGLGEAIALTFAKGSARLAIVDKNAEKLKKTAEVCQKLSKNKVFIIVADLTKDVQVKHVVAETKREYGKIDILVNCAGIYKTEDFLDPNIIKVYDEVVAINLRALISLTNEATPELIATKGCIINVASICGMKALRTTLIYGLTKAAVIHFTKGAALELADKGVRVNSIAPGIMRTNFLLNNTSISVEDNDKFMSAEESRSPLKTLVKVEDAAELVSFLASDKAIGITGANFKIDAGRLLK